MPNPPLSQALAKRLRALHDRKGRRLHQQYLLEGVKLVHEALRAQAPLQAIVWGQGATLRHPDLYHRTLATQAEVYLVADAELPRLSTHQHPEGVLALAPIRPPATPTTPLWPSLWLDGLRDPGNLGTLLRTADWFGLPAIYCTADCVDLHNPKVVRAGMGAHFRVAVHYLDDLPTWAAPHAQQLALASLQGTPLQQVDWAQRRGVVLGGESHGLRHPWPSLAGAQAVCIPGGGGAESLNAAVAGGILMAQWVAMSQSV